MKHFPLSGMNLKNLLPGLSLLLLLIFFLLEGDLTSDVNVLLLQPIKKSRYSLCSEVWVCLVKQLSAPKTVKAMVIFPHTL